MVKQFKWLMHIVKIGRMICMSFQVTDADSRTVQGEP